MTMNLINSIESTAVQYWDAATAYEDIPSVTVSPWIEVADALNGMRTLVDELDIPDHGEAVETLRLLHSIALERE